MRISFVIKIWFSEYRYYRFLRKIIKIVKDAIRFRIKLASLSSFQFQVLYKIPTACKLKMIFFLFLRVHILLIGILIARKKSSVIWARIPRLKISPRSRRSFCGGSSYFLILCIFVIKSILTRQHNQDGPLIATLFRHQTGAEFSNNAASAKNRLFIPEISSLTHL